jgi:hypothetical protein
MNKQQTIELLESQLPSFYSQEQVIAIIKGIDEETPKLSSAQVADLIQCVEDKVSRVIEDADTEDMVDLSSAEFDINYDNRLELSRVDLTMGDLCNDVKTAIDSSITDFLATL